MWLMLEASEEGMFVVFAEILTFKGILHLWLASLPAELPAQARECGLAAGWLLKLGSRSAQAWA